MLDESRKRIHSYNLNQVRLAHYLRFNLFGRIESLYAIDLSTELRCFDGLLYGISMYCAFPMSP
jgi:hypothetical protein